MQKRRMGKTEEMVSVLGFGCMRLPLLDPNDAASIDEEKSLELVRYAIDNGVNYIDTAYPYHGNGMGGAGKSEPFVAKLLKDGYREKVKLATKLPSWLINSPEDMDKYLDEQLNRLQTDHIDFYLVHSLNKTVWEKLKKLGIGEFLDKAIKDKRIRHAGFSFHDTHEYFNEIVDYYDWSFCQIQFNYLDEDFQAGLDGLNYAAAKDMGIVIMEPLRGGKLANDLPSEVHAAFESSGIKRSPAQWALRWVLNHPKVSVALSGMNTMQQIKENIEVSEQTPPDSMTDEETDIINQAKHMLKSRIKINCTACKYCLPCPAGVNIPGCFTMYNSHHMFGKEENYIRMMPEDQRASKCVECGQCEEHCPQSIAIREELKKVKELFGS